MGLLCDFLVADDETALAYDGMGTVADDVLRLKGLTSLQAAQMWAVLGSREYSVDMLGEFELISPEEGESWTQRVPVDMVDRLAGVEEAEVERLSREFAEATHEELGWGPDDFGPVVRGLAALAHRAVSTGRSMYLWNAL